MASGQYPPSAAAGQGLTLNPSTGLLDNNLTTGLAGGQIVKGGANASENLTLTSTANATKGQIQIGGSTGLIVDEANGKFFFGNGGSALGYIIGVKVTSAGGALFAFQAVSGSQDALVQSLSANVRMRFIVANNSVSTILGTSRNSSDNNGYLENANGLQFWTNSTLALSIDGSSLVNIGVPGVTANGTGTVTTGNLAPGTTAVTIQEWWTLKTASGTRRIPLYG